MYLEYVEIKVSVYVNDSMSWYIWLLVFMVSHVHPMSIPLRSVTPLQHPILSRYTPFRRIDASAKKRA